MQIRSLELKNFRCFPSYRQNFAGPLTLIQGDNGSGKTSILEALYYACYVKSFRTHKSGEVAKSGEPSFFIKVVVEDGAGQEHTLSVGFDQGKKEVKVNGKAVTSYKELVSLYRVVAITEDDLLLIKGEPEIRRTFIDQVLLTGNPSYGTTVSTYRAHLKQRNALINSPQFFDQHLLTLWTEKLWALSEAIRQERCQIITKLEQQANKLITSYFPELGKLTCTYQIPEENQGVVSVKQWLVQSGEHERHAQRTLFGPHLDDIRFELGSLACKQYASRGQQKLVAVILKLAHLGLVCDKGAVVLLDDFMTDFDPERARVLLELLKSYQTHLLFTTPLAREQALYLFNKEFETLSITGSKGN